MRPSSLPPCTLRLNTPSCFPPLLDVVSLTMAYSCQRLDFGYRVETAQSDDGVFEIGRSFWPLMRRSAPRRVLGPSNHYGCAKCHLSLFILRNGLAGSRCRREGAPASSPLPKGVYFHGAANRTCANYFDTHCKSKLPALGGDGRFWPIEPPTSNHCPRPPLLLKLLTGTKQGVELFQTAVLLS
jgi:hypothetical protein